jgi:cell division protein FtsW (lipid II flippase)
MTICSKIPYQLYERYARHIFGIGIAGLIIVLVAGTKLNGATGWIDIP